MTSKTERMIHGICSTERVVDHSRASDGSNNQVLLARGCALATPVPLLLEHSGDVVGRVIHLRRIEDKIYCRAIIHDDRVWQKIERCELRGLSIGVTHQHYVIKMRAEEGIVRYYDQFTINEVSLTNQPANRDC